MAVFTWINHEHSTKYPTSGFRMALGNSYMATAAPTAPDQRVITLEFTTMKYFQNSNGTLNLTTNLVNNFGALEAFWMTYKLFGSFTYNHPVYGALSVKFNKPLEIPKAMKSGDGWLMPFSLELLEQP